ncbi:MAG: (d)CMP kinase [Salinivirgaceae bacterium]|jgi:cytidylate kinase
MSEYYQIAVDGFSSCGKSTLARQIGEVLHITYIDSGAMYRAAALLALQHKCIVNGKLQPECFRPILQKADIQFHKSTNHVLLNGDDVEAEIRQHEVAENVSEVASHGFVRTILMQLQRNYSDTSSVVMDGRDIGTHVFPHAQVKLFIVADAHVRAERRFRELQEKNTEATFEQVLDNIQKRDELDQTREVAPLRKADDAVEIDNGNLTREEQLELALRIINEKLEAKL